MENKLLSIYERTTDHERQAGKDWYPKARAFCDSIAFWTDRPLWKVVAITSALSPQLSWEYNKIAAEYFCKGERVVGVLKASLKKAKAIDNGQYPLSTAFPLKTCPKTNNFYHNILNPDDSRYVTIDRHAAAALDIPREHCISSLYWTIAEAYKKTAKHVGMTASAFQATIWTYTRNHGQVELYFDER